MSKFIKLKKGFDINLLGKAEKKIADCPQPETFALKPTDFQNITRPKLLVGEGDTVKAGTPLFYDKTSEKVMFTAPVSGEVVEVKRGAKRRLLEIKILADREVGFEQFKSFSVSDLKNLSKEEATEQMTQSGVWPNIIQRPYGVIANPEDSPKAIFISGFNSHPLAGDYGFMLKGADQYFQAGIDILSKFTSGMIHLNLSAREEVPTAFANAKGIQLNKFSGPHPAGNVGVQIHHLDPINKGEVAWTLSPYAVVQIGKLFVDGKYDASKMVALTGSEVSNPQYYSTYSGACINKMITGNMKSDNVRYISGNVLTGEKISKDGYLGYYDNQLTIIPEGDQYEFLGWILPTVKKLSFHKAFGLFSFLNGKKGFALTTNTNGEDRAFVQSGTFEKVMPMDILPTHLIKSILAEDYDEMEALGIYEVIEEDMALCEFVDVSKHDIQAILREGIDLIQNS